MQISINSIVPVFIFYRASLHILSCQSSYILSCQSSYILSCQSSYILSCQSSYADIHKLFYRASLHMQISINYLYINYWSIFYRASLHMQISINYLYINYWSICGLPRRICFLPTAFANLLLRFSSPIEVASESNIFKSSSESSCKYFRQNGGAYPRTQASSRVPDGGRDSQCHPLSRSDNWRRKTMYSIDRESTASLCDGLCDGRQCFTLLGEE